MSESNLPDYCAQCGTALEQLDHGGRKQCCNGLGYWSTVVPLPEDAFEGQQAVKSPQGDKYLLYVGAVFRWKPGMKKPRAKPNFPKKK